jgi:hypothetical protein
MQAIRHAQALARLCRKRDQSLDPVSDRVPDTGSESLEPYLHQCFLRDEGAILCHLCQQELPGREGHAN